jgi:hypothetical protein
MALTDGRYVTATQLRDHVGVADVLDDVRLQVALSAAETWVDEWCGRKFDASSHGHGGGSVSTRTYVVSDPYVVQIGDMSNTTGLIVVDNGTTLGSSGFQLEPVDAPEHGRPWTQIRRMGNTWAIPTDFGRASVSVTAHWGWPVVPDPVVRATLAAAGWLFAGSSAPLGIAGANEFGPMRLAQLPPLVGALLATYRRGDRAIGIA